MSLSPTQSSSLIMNIFYRVLLRGLFSKYLHIMRHPIPTLEVEDRAWLDRDITFEEIEAAGHLFPPAQILRPDGSPVEWYRQYFDTLPPRLQSLYSYCFKHEVLPPSMLEAYVVLLHKLGKDHMCCASYRLITLLNAESKNSYKGLGH